MAILQDVRQALRLSSRSPGVTAVALTSIAITIGATTVVFAAVKTVLLDPFPYVRSNELVQLRAAFPKARFRPHFDWVSWADMQDVKRASRSFESLATFHYDLINLTGDDNHAPETLYGLNVSADLFPMLGVKPMLGRNILPEEEQIGRDQELILSYGLWARRFSSDPTVIGKSVEVNGRPRIVIGVMPQDFDFPLRLAGTTRTPSQHMDFWAPEAVDPAKTGRILGYCAVARLKPGVTAAKARDEVEAIAANLERSYPGTNRGRSLDLVSLREETLGSAESGLWLLMGAAVLFMLIGCANVTNLLLARSLARNHEIKVRLALGAGPKRIVRQLVTESCVLAIAGGLAGFGLTTIAWKLLPALAPVTIPRLAETRADGTILGFAVAIAVLNGFFFGLAPALRAARMGADSLRDAGNRGSVGCPRSRLRSTLVVAEVAVAVTLVLVGGVLTASFLQLLGTDAGFDKNVLASIVTPSNTQYDTTEKRELLFRRIVDAVRNVPGVQLAGTVDVLPFSGVNNGGSVVRSDDPLATMRGHGFLIEFDHVSADYLPAMGVHLLDGRWFRDDDLASGRDVAIINDALAKKLWPSENAIGKEICLNCYGPSFRERKRIVGVVRTTRHSGLDDPGELQVYETAKAYEYADFVVVRSARPANELAKAVRLAIASVDPKQPVFLSVSMAQLISDSVADRRFVMLLIAITGALALLLAAAGIYGVISYTTSLRTSEIGVRMALGATPRNVQRLVFRGGMLLAGIGIAIGVAAALAITRVLRNVMTGLAANDPLLIAAAIAVVLATAALACWIPARRATRIDPMVALREN